MTLMRLLWPNCTSGNGKASDTHPTTNNAMHAWYVEYDSSPNVTIHWCLLFRVIHNLRHWHLERLVSYHFKIAYIHTHRLRNSMRPNDCEAAYPRRVSLWRRWTADSSNLHKELQANSYTSCTRLQLSFMVILLEWSSRRQNLARQS